MDWRECDSPACFAEERVGATNREKRARQLSVRVRSPAMRELRGGRVSVRPVAECRSPEPVDSCRCEQSGDESELEGVRVWAVRTASQRPK
jgi:hypothetical protein